MKTALDRYLAANPGDPETPERRDHESFRDFKIRELFYYASKAAKKHREAWGKGVVKK